MTTTKQKQRLLIVFAPNQKNADYAAFARELKDRSLDVAAADMLVMEALEVESIGVAVTFDNFWIKIGRTTTGQVHILGIFGY